MRAHSADAVGSIPGGDAGMVVAPFTVRVMGWPEMTYIAGSRGKALAKCWGDYRAHDNDVSFKDFLRLASARKAERSGRFGEPVLVGDEPAFFVSHVGQYVQFVRAGSDQVINSHPLDVKRLGATTSPDTQPGTKSEGRSAPNIPADGGEGGQ